MTVPDEDYDISMTILTRIFGMPGEEVPVWLADKDAPDGDPNATSNLYRAELLLGRPGHLPERSMFDGFRRNVQGSSYVRLSKAKSERRPRDLHQMVISLRAGKVYLLPNDEGYAAKLVTDSFHAPSFEAAEEYAVALVAPLLVGWSAYLDTPLHVDKVFIEDLGTKRTFHRASTDQWEVGLGPAGSLPLADDEFTHFASLYNEAICTSSSIYRFLCLFKLVESLGDRRSAIKRKSATADNSQSPAFITERYPGSKEELSSFLRAAYPHQWLPEFGTQFISQTWRPLVAGKSFNAILADLSPARNKIAHSFMKNGEYGISIKNVNQDKWLRAWLPLLRCMARIRLRNEFPKSFIFQPKTPLLLGSGS